MKQFISTLGLLAALLCSCSKEAEIGTGNSTTNPVIGTSPDLAGIIYTAGDSIKSSSDRAILVDASKDGGGWWFPQVPGGFSATAHHQGKKLADYFRLMGFKIHEVTRGSTITNAMLSHYTNLIRAGGAGQYTTAELNAYEAFLARPTSLLLTTDHLRYFPNDALSLKLGLNFEGVYFGTVSGILPHPVTENVVTFPFNAGSVIKKYDPARITLLGFLGEDGVMGELKHPSARIFFLSDINGIETVPQPFTSNLVNWLFR